MRILVLTGCWLLATAILFPWNPVAASEGARVEYIGGTAPVIQKKTDGNLLIGSDTQFEFRMHKSAVKLDYSKINLLEYGQKVDRRYAMALLISPMFLLSKSRQHFLTIGYTDEENRQQAMVFRVAKGAIRSVLVSLEARTGLKVQYQDTEARKAGRS